MRACNLSLESCRRTICKLEAKLVYKASFRVVRSTQNPVSKGEKKKPGVVRHVTNLKLAWST